MSNPHQAIREGASSNHVVQARFIYARAFIFCGKAQMLSRSGVAGKSLNPILRCERFSIYSPRQQGKGDPYSQSVWLDVASVDRAIVHFNGASADSKSQS